MVWILGLVGCSSNGENEKNSIIPPSNDTMKEVYTNGGRSDDESVKYSKAIEADKLELFNRGVLGNKQDESVYRLNSVNTQADFMKLHNPTLYLYFPPKISVRDALPIPAWMTEFKMYDKDTLAIGADHQGARQ
jgi:conjugative transfer region lipoprotein (TIGR03751 family)